MSGPLACAAMLAGALAAGAAPDPALPSGSRPRAEGTVGQTQERLQKVRERKEALLQEVEALRGQEQGVLGDVERLELGVRLRGQELREIQLTLRRNREETAQAQRRAEELTGSLEAARPAVIARARALYKLGEFSYLRLLLSVEHPVDVLRAYRFVSALAREDKQRVARFRRDLDELAETRADLETKAREATELRAEVERRRRRLDAERKQKTALLTSLVEQKEVHLAYLQELHDAEGQLQQLLDEGGATVPPVPIAALRGSLPWPVAGKVRVGFGPRKSRFETVTPHNGIEIESSPEAEARAVHEGTVAFAGRFRGYGLMVVLDHGGKHHTLYAQLAEVSVAVGARVAAGEVLGVLSSEEPAVLYFELRQHGKPVDPLPWLAEAAPGAPSGETHVASAHRTAPPAAGGKKTKKTKTRTKATGR